MGTGTYAGSSVDGLQEPSQPMGEAKSGSVTLRSVEGVVDDDDEKRPCPAATDDIQIVEKPIDEDVKKQSAEPERENPELHYVTGMKLVLVSVGMMLSVFLVTLDQTIVATAIPRIASDFVALEQATWIASAYFLTQGGLILTYGQLLSVFNAKYVYLSAVALFEVGSTICGAAPNMNVLIFGRAFAGVGAAGIFVSVLAILARITPLEKRPIFFGLFGMIFAFSSVCGPLLGGAFTDKVSWRWCFYINLPFGAITLLTIFLFIKPRHAAPPVANELPFWTTVRRIDWIGCLLSLSIITSLLLPLQWGGVTKSWSDKSVVACFCVFAVVLPMFVLWEWYKGDDALMPLHMWKNRTQIGCCFEAFFIMLVMLCCIYYLPLFYQSSEKKSATESGISIITFMVCIVTSAMGSGIVINKTGRPLPFLLLSPLLAGLGCGLVFWDLTMAHSAAWLYAFQTLMGLGVGAALQNTLIVIQAEFMHRPNLVSQATALVNFTQLSGGILGIAISGTIFGNRLAASIAKYAPNLPSSTASTVRQSVAAIYVLEGQDQANVIRAYSEALGYVFILGVPAAILASISAVLIKNHNLRDMNVEHGAAVAV